MATAGTVDIQEFINSRPVSRYQIMVIVLCFLVVAAGGDVQAGDAGAAKLCDRLAKHVGLAIVADGSRRRHRRRRRSGVNSNR